jgi:hypothetical protein
MHGVVLAYKIPAPLAVLGAATDWIVMNISITVQNYLLG